MDDQTNKHLYKSPTNCLVLVAEEQKGAGKDYIYMCILQQVPQRVFFPCDKSSSNYCTAGDCIFSIASRKNINKLSKK